MNLGLQGRVAAVCAGSQGLGRAVAVELAREGAHIAVCARNEGPLAALHDEIAAINGHGALGVLADVGEPDDLDSFLQEIAAEWRMPDIVIWNAGGPPPGPILEVGDEAFAEGVRLHLAGALHFFRRTVPPMVSQRWGRVIAITSVTVKQPMKNMGISNSVRAGLTGILKTLAEEVGRFGVTVNSVLPGYTLTQRLRALAESRAAALGISPAAVLDQFAATTPAARLGEPQDLAAAVAFLASDRAGYINGVSLPVDGGLCRSLL